MKLNKIFINSILFTSILSVTESYSKESNEIFTCISPAEVSKESVSLAKFQYVIKMPNDNIKLHSHPIYRWEDTEPTSFVRATIKYLSNKDYTEEIVDCYYKTVTYNQGRKIDTTKEIDIKYDDYGKYDYEPYKSKIWKHLSKSKISCDKSSEDCSINLIPFDHKN